jgi:8-hydroxy-5-deazaflavin:NADPH oxidoreductase
VKIGIIGAGQIGGTLTRRLRSLGHEVRVANSRDPKTLAELADETGATAVWAADAAQDADLVIISIPAAKPGAALIETNNYDPQQRDGLIEAIESGTPESVWVAEQVGSPVVKVFNGIWWKRLLENGKPKGDEGRIALPVAGADGPAKQLVFDVVEELGFDAVDGGTLEESWRQQPGTPVYGKDYDIPATKQALSEATPERPADFRAER